jgi:hypothetical protein
MKSFIAAFAFLVTLGANAQTYKVGILKTGATVKNIDGLIVMADTVVTSTIDGQTTTMKIVSRKGFTVHVTDGTMQHKYIISHGKGRLHGFTYDCSIKYELDKRHSPGPHPVYLCAVVREGAEKDIK